MNPDQITFQAGDLPVAALAWGAPADRLALCLHGYPDTAWTWRHLGPRLAADGWRVVAPFMRGYAPTGVPADGDYSIAALGRDAVAIRDALGGGPESVLVGHDWGATATYAAAPTGAFARIVSMSVPPAPWLLAAARTPLGARQARHSWYMAYQQLPIEGTLDRLIPRLWSAWSPGYDGREDLERVFAALDTTERRRAALGYYRALRRARPGRMPVPRGPWLYLHGRQDGCMLADLVPDGESRAVVVDRAGHFLQLEQPEVVGELVAGFLSG